MAATGHFLNLKGTSSLPSRRNSPRSTTATRLKCHLSSPHQNPFDNKPLKKSTPPTKPLNSSNSPEKPLIKTLAVSAASALLFHLASSFSGGPPGGPPGGYGFGGGGGGGGGFWSRLFSSPATAKDEENDDESEQWDPHGLQANATIRLHKLDAFKKYKISDLSFYDRSQRATVGAEDSFFEMVSLRPNGVYTKSQLQKELETLSTCGMFEKVDLEAKTNPNGTIGITISFSESKWQSANSFKCINVGLMSQSKPIEMSPNMTEREQMEYTRSLERDYNRRVDLSRPCLLPRGVKEEVLRMLGEQNSVSARLLQRIRDHVQKWYHDQGYACAEVVNFGNLNTKEVVCEVVEGDITQLVIQFQDKLGNLVEGNTRLEVVERELPKQVVMLSLVLSL